MIQKTWNSFIYAIRGLKTVWQEERNFQIEIIIAALVIFCMFYFHFNLLEIVFCIIAITIVLTVEIINTVFEDLCNKIEPNEDPAIGKIKDMSSSFVLVASFGSLLLGILVFLAHFY